ncbi:hypothetical protein HSR122_2334 [Halapricum desulfuricans]|uniref:Uncharacterized protein n=1 Tax=Halapricum desulfuricans TaxID=2841257 RepID=A0A897NAG6_9EURY|nr:hypothetical protein HSR122_2334 [Halapricum desulfuricans]
METDMPVTDQLRAHEDRNEVPDGVSPTTVSTDREREASGRAPPFDAFALPHMRAVDSPE